MFNDIVIDVKDSDSSSSESEYDYSCNSEESAVGDVERESLQKKTSSAAVGASGGNASVAATCGSPPFEPESQVHPVFYVQAALFPASLMTMAMVPIDRQLLIREYNYYMDGRRTGSLFNRSRTFRRA